MLALASLIMPGRLPVPAVALRSYSITLVASIVFAMLDGCLSKTVWSCATKFSVDDGQGEKRFTTLLDLTMLTKHTQLDDFFSYSFFFSIHVSSSLHSSMRHQNIVIKQDLLKRLDIHLSRSSSFNAPFILPRHQSSLGSQRHATSPPSDLPC